MTRFRVTSRGVSHGVFATRKQAEGYGRRIKRVAPDESPEIEELDDQADAPAVTRPIDTTNRFAVASHRGKVVAIGLLPTIGTYALNRDGLTLTPAQAKELAAWLVTMAEIAEAEADTDLDAPTFEQILSAVRSA